MPSFTVTEFTDPACPWAWGSEPTFRWLRRFLGARVAWRRVFGILFDEDDDPAPDPSAETAWYYRRLTEIAGHTGAPLPERLERVAATSWPASLAAKAAEAQGPVVADRVLRRLREYTFLLGTPPDTVERALAAVNGVPELDFDRLAADLVTESVHTAVRQDWTETRAPCREVLRIDDPGPHNGRAKPTERGHRYALPTVVVTGPGGRAVIPGWRGPGEYVRAVRQVAPDCVVEPGPLDPVEALRRYRSLTSRDLVLLTGTDRVPGGAVPVHTAGGPLWLHPDEAAVHPATR